MQSRFRATIFTPDSGNRIVPFVVSVYAARAFGRSYRRHFLLIPSLLFPPWFVPRKSSKFLALVSVQLGILNIVSSSSSSCCSLQSSCSKLYITRRLLVPISRNLLFDYRDVPYGLCLFSRLTSNGYRVQNFRPRVSSLFEKSDWLDAKLLLSWFVRENPSHFSSSYLVSTFSQSPGSTRYSLSNFCPRFLTLQLSLFPTFGNLPPSELLCR